MARLQHFQQLNMDVFQTNMNKLTFTKSFPCFPITQVQVLHSGMSRTRSPGRLLDGHRHRKLQRYPDPGHGQQHRGRGVRGHHGLADHREAGSASSWKGGADSSGQAVPPAGAQERRDHRVSLGCSRVSSEIRFAGSFAILDSPAPIIG